MKRGIMVGPMLAQIKLAWRGFLKFRRRRRHLTLVLSGSSFLIFLFFSIFSTLLANQKDYWGKTLVGTDTVILRRDRVYDILKPPGADEYFSLADFVKETRSLDGIITAPRLRISAFLEGYRSENEDITVMIGIDPEKELLLTPAVYLVEGRFPAEEEKGICLFPPLAGSLDVRVGDEVIVYTQTIDGYLNFDLAVVTGILGYEGSQFFPGDYLLSYAPLSFVRELKGLNKEEIVSEIGVRTVSFWDRLRLRLVRTGLFTTVPWFRSYSMATTIHQACSFFMVLIFLLLFAVVGSAVYHNIHLMVLERMRETGVYVVYGARKGWILTIWLWELLIYTLYCALWGIAFALLFTLLINNLGIYAFNEIFHLVLGGDELIIRPTIIIYLQAFGILWAIVTFAALKPLFTRIDENKIMKLLSR